MSDQVRCKCCGVEMSLALGVERLTLRLCPICDMCDRRHGDQLQIAVGKAKHARVITPGLALTRMLVDDAHLAGMLEFRPGPDGRLLLWIPDAVPRWRVLVGRALAVGETVDLPMAIAVICAKHNPPGNRPRFQILDEIRADIMAMFTLLDSGVQDVIVRSKTGGVRPEDLDIEITTTKPQLLAQDLAPEVQVPDDILSRPRGQA